MEHRRHPLPGQTPGTRRQLDSFHYGPANAERSVYFQASLHADELPGMLVAWKLRQRLAELEAHDRLHARICVVPVANPIGLDQQLMDTPLGRYELETLTNFNRHFIDVVDTIAEGLETRLSDDAEHNRTIIRERFGAALNAIAPESALGAMQLTLQQLAFASDYIVDLHCDFNAVEHLYTTPAAWPTFEPLARYFGSKASMLATDSGGQSFDECFTLVWEQLRTRFGDRFPIPYGSESITLELRGQDDVSHELAERDAEAIIHWLMHAGLIDGDAPVLPELCYPATELAAMDFLKAPAAGVLVFHATPGDVVEQDQLLAEIIDPIDDTVHALRAPQGGMMYARSQRRMATRGMIVADIAGHHSHRSGYLLAP
ncbi:succinylglutamate desuccinylase/aspartoacylase family protein [Kushneria phosphatilytica]|uniref:Succinylglutamate desuccinylase/aspartoacylase family protein n=1 Tax=Kushneria phosphatilytica TaxID=657387 RepID=A0A1S1NSW7_9GAMM|nr:succinylglutamate desuccinylase/aspartoacylase family protein [Kushneria phosphatilytica]OHV08434.1 succinylglutamate desuccinylase [Kushneria phosphatilytica]QEL09862.1 succinylglutamate desuccinylase/aspartoacylase family protein [Kushneria phosphatilytica]